MERVGRFEKVSYEQFYQAMKDEYFHPELVMNEAAFQTLVTDEYNEISLPKRATIGSAGYDFHIPFDLTLRPGRTAKIPTGVRVKIDHGWWLGVLPRSGLGFKYRVQLDNTMGVIDSDYFESDNEGHIFAKITNDSRNEKVLTLNTGDAFMQGIFIPYGIAYDDNVDAVRNGGMGSTGK